jgi:TolB-like protein/Tfp pilus assembly protein PilF
MSEKEKKLIEIDLDQFKMHIKINDDVELSLHFDSPSRRFYLSVVAFVVHEMQKLRRITSIPLEEHYELLALLNETVGGSAGSSEKENLIPRVYKKWKSALPDLENAPLFRVLGKTKEYGDAIGRTYSFTDEEKDLWANLFEYKGSGENVRLRFSLDRLGASLDDVVISFKEDLSQADKSAWDRFLDTLEKERIEEQAPMQTFAEPSEGLRGRRKWVALAVAVALILVAAALAIWNFYWRPPPIEPASLEKMAFPLPDKPSIAVLPFVNMSEDPKQEYFADGLTEEIITALSMWEGLFVIARNSTFAYKGRAVKLQQVAEELGVRYVMEGSVRKAEERLRITAQLSDALTGNHIWAERYDRELKDIFAVQDEITVNILSAVKVRFTEGERARLRRKGTLNLGAYLKYLEAHKVFLEGTPENYRVARGLAEEAIALDPEFPAPVRMLGWSHLYEGLTGKSKSTRESMRLAYELAQKAVAMDDSVALNHGLLGIVCLFRKEHERAVAVLQRALELDPNSARGHFYLGWALIWEERPQEAILLVRKALRLSPLDRKFQSMCLYRLARAYSVMGQYEEAIPEFEKALQIRPNHFYTLLYLTAAYILAGREGDARATAKEVLRIHPKVSLEKLAKKLPYKDQALKKREFDAFRKAGLK